MPVAKTGGSEKQTLRSEIARTLNVQEDRLDARLAGLRIGPVCGRCGGSGHYSRNAIDGTRCYGCSGKRVVAPRTVSELKSTLGEAAHAVNSVMLDRYLLFLRSKAVCKIVQDAVMNAWKTSGISSLYEWQKACLKSLDGVPESPHDHDYSLINRLFADGYQHLSNEMAKTGGRSTPEAEEREKIIALSEQINRTIETFRSLEERLLSANGPPPESICILRLVAGLRGVSSQRVFGRPLRDSVFDVDDHIVCRSVCDRAIEAVRSGSDTQWSILEELAEFSMKSPIGFMGQDAPWKANADDSASMRKAIGAVVFAVNQAEQAIEARAGMSPNHIDMAAPA